MEYLSAEWIERADEELAAAWSAADPAVTGSVTEPTTIAYEVTGGPHGKVAYGLHLGPDGAGMSAGAPDDPGTTMALDWTTAVEIARGEVSAQVAFMQGRLKLGGDVTVLIRGAAALAVVGDALGALRDTTEF